MPLTQFVDTYCIDLSFNMTYLSELAAQFSIFASESCLECDGDCYTYSHLASEVTSWSSYLATAGVNKGAVVALRADYSLASIAALIALLRLHAIAALIPRHGNVQEYVNDARASALLEIGQDGHHNFTSLSESPDHPLLALLRASSQGGFVIFSSGSTGRPKAALQGVENFLLKFRKSGRRFRTLAFMVFDHVAGLDTLFYTLRYGGTLIVPRRRDPDSILNLLDSKRVEVMPTTPTFLRMLCATPHLRQHDVSTLKVITYGSELMDASTLARLNLLFPTAQISQKYGTTETGSPRAISRSNSSLWVKIKNDSAETKIVDGVLWIRSEATMLGYLNAPSPLDSEGWYCTGDLVETDGDWIRFKGRAAEIINVGGEKVSPGEIEETLLELSFIRDALVASEPHPIVGQIVVAHIALFDNASEEREAIRTIRAHCRKRLAPYKRPVRIYFEKDGFINPRHKRQRVLPPNL